MSLRPRRPHPVTDSIGLDRLEPLEIEERLEKPVAGRIAVVDRHDIGPRRLAKGGSVLVGFVGHLAQDLLRHLAGGQFLRQPVGQRAFQPAMVQDDRMQHATQERLVRDRLRRLLGDPFPDGIERGNL
jgi:hypothetical protein